ncbi:CubicO group peptidase (beta-lactamase class C family) [Chitinophaga niastensis]|uniref:CubicO group peptidase (Beta-lactamase class C family) n=1 Tax=Chitinophaga niastensis TaxID=536980 RepID=A0A2P8HD87_CHINA|nr:serine hydrolase domain-containing protein [Chitinophaga niastensis]PSL44203.1 CubicO group peptidase (beta-lactamase class C family) [Chitinophaga niastensis]
MLKYLIACTVFFGFPTILFTACSKSDTTTVINGSQNYSDIDKVLNDSVPAKFGGRCYAVINVNGQTVYKKGFGGYDGSTKLLIASCSKWLSAAVLMSLVDEGKIKLTDTVGQYLPIFTSYHKGSITIAQLFSHTSGFPGNSSQGYESDVLLTLSQAADLIAKNVALINLPGTTFYYGGVSMQVAGRICEVASGKSWKVLAAEKVFTPSGMNNTDYGLTANPGIAGGARSTPDDYIGFLDMIMHKGVADNGTRILSEAAVAAMEQSQTGNVVVAYSPYPVALINTINIYGIGNWRDVTGPGDVLIENSSPGLFGSHPWVNRGKQLTGFLFTFIPVNGYQITMPTALKIRSLARSK